MNESKRLESLVLLVLLQITRPISTINFYPPYVVLTICILYYDCRPITGSCEPKGFKSQKRNWELRCCEK